MNEQMNDGENSVAVGYLEAPHPTIQFESATLRCQFIVLPRL